MTTRCILKTKSGSTLYIETSVDQIEGMPKPTASDSGKRVGVDSNGNYILVAPGSITPTGNLNITTTAQVDVSTFATAQVTDANLIASNIKQGVTILGVTGTYSG